MKYHLELYVTKETPNSTLPQVNVKKICREALKKDDYKLEIIDVLKETHMPWEDSVVCTPTLVIKRPAPSCHIVGNLINREEVMSERGLAAKGNISQGG